MEVQISSLGSTILHEKISYQNSYVATSGAHASLVTAREDVSELCKSTLTNDFEAAVGPL